VEWKDLFEKTKAPPRQTKPERGIQGESGTRFTIS
jgi:hypothetical protein